MKIESWNYKPRRHRMLGKRGEFVGIELEIEAPGLIEYDRGLGIKERSNFFYFKHDSSVENGYEIVTQPIASDIWLQKRGSVRELFKVIGRMQRMGFKSFASGRCGLHVHLEREIIGNVFTRQQVWLLRALWNTDMMWRISRRDCGMIKNNIRHEHAKQVPLFYKIDHNVENSALNRRMNDKYQAFNTRNSRTIEVRIFRGNMREKRIRAAVELCIASKRWVYTFDENSSTRVRRMFENGQDGIFSDFENYALRNEEKYQNACEAIEEAREIERKDKRDSEQSMREFIERNQMLYRIHELMDEMNETERVSF